MSDIFDIEFDTADTLYSNPRFAVVKARILKAIGKSRGMTIREIKNRLKLPKRTDDCIFDALRMLERDGKITNVAKKDISGESLGASLYVLGGKEMKKLAKVPKKQCSGDKIFASAKKNIYADLGL